jgi:hypothetical protein
MNPWQVGVRTGRRRHLWFRAVSGFGLSSSAIYTSRGQSRERRHELGEARLFLMSNRHYRYGLIEFAVSLSMEADPDYMAIGHLVDMT